MNANIKIWRIDSNENINFFIGKIFDQLFLKIFNFGVVFQWINKTHDL